MVWGGITAHGRTPLVVVAGNLTGIRYRDEMVQPYVIPFIQAQAVGYCSKCGSMPDPFPLKSLADLADGVTVVPFHPKHAQWVKDRVKLLAMVTNQH
jgi:hypothetical protein